jgi:feruloyl esterase
LAGGLSRAGWAEEPITAGSVAHPAIPCGSLKRFVPADLVVEKLEAVHAGTVKVGPAGIVEFPAHCLFRGTLAPRTSTDGQHFGIGMELRLPLAWNGKFVFQGGGGLDGVLAASYGTAGGADPPALARGFAVVSTDGGHRSGSMIDAHFALDQQARIDYAYNAVDKTTLFRSWHDPLCRRALDGSV